MDETQTAMVEVTMKSGAVVRFRTSRFKVNKNVLGEVSDIEWERDGNPTLLHLNLNEMVAVVWNV